MQGYFFFAGQVDTPFLVGEPVFPIKVEEEKYVKARESLLEAALRQDGPLFARCFAQFAKLVCWMADGKKEDACFYFCSAIHLLGERLQALKLEGGPPDMKGLLEQGRGSPSYDTLLQTYREVLLGHMGKLQRALAQSDTKYLLKALSYIEAHYAENLTLGRCWPGSAT